MIMRNSGAPLLGEDRTRAVALPAQAKVAASFNPQASQVRWTVCGSATGGRLKARGIAMNYAIKDIGAAPAIRASLLDLNNRNARETSLLDAGKLARMIEAARVATVVEPDAAFLLAFDRDADYDGLNFIWFRERFDAFLYIDRVIVGEDHRRVGLGRRLYHDLFHRAQQLAFRRIACEINVVPPNPLSDAFHATLGFAEIGRATTGDGTKSVRYLLRDV